VVKKKRTILNLPPQHGNISMGVYKLVFDLTRQNHDSQTNTGTRTYSRKQNMYATYKREVVTGFSLHSSSSLELPGKVKISFLINHAIEVWYI
jgi:hypothetical protein